MRPATETFGSTFFRGFGSGVGVTVVTHGYESAYRLRVFVTNDTNGCTRSRPIQPDRRGQGGRTGINGLAPGNCQAPPRDVAVAGVPPSSDP